MVLWSFTLAVATPALIAAQVEIPNPSSFNTPLMGGLRGWLLTLTIILGFSLLYQLFGWWRDRTRSKREDQLLMLVKESVKFQETVSKSLEILTNQYAENISQRQVVSLTNACFDLFQSRIMVYATRVRSKSGSMPNGELMHQLREQVHLDYEEAISGTLNVFKTRKGLPLSTYIQESDIVPEIVRLLHSSVTKGCSNENLEVDIDRKISTIRNSYHKKIQLEL